MFGLGLTEMGIVTVIVLLIFGPSRLPQLGKSIGRAISNFRSSVARKGDVETSGTKDRTDGTCC